MYNDPGKVIGNPSVLMGHDRDHPCRVVWWAMKRARKHEAKTPFFGSRCRNAVKPPEFFMS